VRRVQELTTCLGSKPGWPEENQGKKDGIKGPQDHIWVDFRRRAEPLTKKTRPTKRTMGKKARFRGINKADTGKKTLDVMSIHCSGKGGGFKGANLGFQADKDAQV